jgi:hypothetical protein
MIRRNVTFLTLVALIVVFWVGRYSTNLNSARAESSLADDARLKELLKERVALRKRAYEIVSTPGIASKSEIARAHIEMMRAELDLCQTKAQRIEVLQRIVDQAKEFEASLNVPGAGGVIDRLAGPITRVEAEIALEREKLKP